MAYNLLDAFSVGQKIGKAKRSTFGMTSDDLMENFKTDREATSKIGPTLVGALFKEKLERDRPTSELDKSTMAKNYALADKASNPQELSPSLQAQKDKRIQGIFDTFEGNQIKRNKLQKASASMSKIPTGLAGKVQTMWMKSMDPNNPIMTDWQNVKSVLTDAQLQNVAKTKGAISDREMELFAQAAANDDLMSVARMKPVLQAMENAINSSEQSAVGSYRQIYQDDPLQWPEMQQYQNSGSNMSPANSSPQDGARKRLEEKLRQKGLL